MVSEMVVRKECQIVADDVGITKQSKTEKLARPRFLFTVSWVTTSVIAKCFSY